MYFLKLIDPLSQEEPMPLQGQGCPFHANMAFDFSIFT